jgi:hypothetical protein
MAANLSTKDSRVATEDSGAMRKQPMWLFKFTDRNFVGKLESLGGTGKYDGPTLTGDFKPAGGNVPFAAPGVIQTCNRVVGAYRLR